jgi:hypothetical protein
MKARHTRARRSAARFDPDAVDADAEFTVDWEEADPETEDVEAREAVMRELGDRPPDD